MLKILVEQLANNFLTLDYHGAHSKTNNKKPNVNQTKDNCQTSGNHLNIQCLQKCLHVYDICKHVNKVNSKVLQ